MNNTLNIVEESLSFSKIKVFPESNADKRERTKQQNKHSSAFRHLYHTK